VTIKFTFLIISDGLDFKTESIKHTATTLQLEYITKRSHMITNYHNGCATPGRWLTLRVNLKPTLSLLYSVASEEHKIPTIWPFLSITDKIDNQKAYQ
jgi:hypothetical protein